MKMNKDYRSYTLDQSFSANNLRKIFDLENRKGHYLEGRFFSEEISSKIEEITRELKECHSGYKDLKKNKDSLLSQEYETQRITLNKKKEELVDEKEKLLTATLEKISKEITDNSFKITLKIQNKLTKVVYATEKKDAATYFGSLIICTEFLFFTTVSRLVLYHFFAFNANSQRTHLVVRKT